MSRQHMIAWGATALGLLALACQPAQQKDDRATPAAAATAGPLGVVAVEIDGEPLTVDEVDEWIKNDLFESRAGSPSKLFELRQQGIEGLVQERVLEVAARKRGVTVEELVQLEAESLGEVTDEEVKTFFDENNPQMGDVTLDKVSDRIRDFLASRREGEAVAALQEKATVVIHLEAPRIEVSSTGPSKGPADAKVTIVEFSDFQCPFCRRVIPTLDAILEKYPNDVRVVYRNMPLGSHQRARPAAEAALCAQEQGQFWPYHDKLFENTRALDDEDLKKYAEEVGLDVAKFDACYAEGRFAELVATDTADAREAGVSGTPAFFVNGVMLSGAKPPEDFFRLIDAELSRL